MNIQLVNEIANILDFSMDDMYIFFENINLKEIEQTDEDSEN